MKLTFRLPLRTGILMLAANAVALVALQAAAAPLTPDQTIEVPHGKGSFDFLEVDAARGRLLGAHEKDGTADFFDLSKRALLGRVAVGPAVDVAVDPKNGRYFVSVSDDKRVAIIDPESLTEIGSVALSGPTDGIVFDPKNRQVYVTHDDGAEVWVIDADSAKVVASIPVPGVPEYMLYDPTSDRLYLNIKDKNRVVAIDPASGAVAADWPIIPVTGPHGLAIDSASGRLFVAGDNGKLAVIEIATGRVLTTVPIAMGVDQAAFDPSLKRVYCAGAGRLSVVQETAAGATGIGEIETPPGAMNVAVNPADHSVWMTYSDGQASYAKSWVPTAGVGEAVSAVLPKIFVQSLVPLVMDANSDLLVIGVHAVAPGATVSKVIASNRADLIGEKDDDDDLAAAKEQKLIFSPNPDDAGRVELLLPLKTAGGGVIGALVLVFKQDGATDETAIVRKGTTIRNSLAKQIADLPALFAPIE